MGRKTKIQPHFVTPHHEVLLLPLFVGDEEEEEDDDATDANSDADGVMKCNSRRG